MTVTGEQGSTVPRRRLGRELRKLREGAQLTIEKVIKELEWSRQKIWRIERGESAMRVLDVEAMCKVYGASEQLTDALKALAKETRAKGWYHSYDDVIPKWMEMYIDLESTAKRIYQYSSELVPGLLQTPAYAEAVFKTSVTLAVADLERSVEVRLGRQEIFRKQDLKIDWILNEAVIRRVVGSRAVMAEQLRHLASFNTNANLSVRVLPYAAGAHTAMIGPFDILEFPKDIEPTTVHIDGLTGSLYLEKEREIQAYRRMFENSSKAALSEKESRELILQTAKEFSSA